MARIILRRRIVEDRFSPLAPDASALPASGAVLAPLDWWLAQRDAIDCTHTPLGVLLEPQHDPERIARDLDRLALVAVHFPQFSDGRGYSTAALLRGRYGYRGELRAIGDIGRDQLHYLSRCGFDAFALRPNESLEAALASLDAFSEAYQASASQPQPLFRRRLAGSA